MSRVCSHVLVRGRVQGVSFRAFVADEALKRGIEGWVRNRRDGSVEALFFGTVDKVEAMLAVSRQGPPASRVDMVERRDGRPEEFDLRKPGELFSVLPTV
jgi:acylphosphatase